MIGLTKSSMVSKSLALLLSALAIRSCVCQDFQYEETDFTAKGQVQQVTVPARSVLYSCDFKSSTRLKYVVSSTYPIYSYSVAESDLKDVKLEGSKPTFTFERRSACFNRTLCESFSNGRILHYSKCFVLNNAVGTADALVSLKLTAKFDEQILAIYGLIAAVTVGLIGIITFVLCRVCNGADCDCLADCWRAHGKAARKGYSPYQTSAV